MGNTNLSDALATQQLLHLLKYILIFLVLVPRRVPIWYTVKVGTKTNFVSIQTTRIRTIQLYYSQWSLFC